MRAPCIVCGRPSDELHHSTGRDASGAYLDPKLRLPLCHDDHEIQHDDWHTLGISSTGAGLTRLELRELGLRRIGTLFGRVAESASGAAVYGPFASWSVECARDLRLTINAFDDGDATWRALPGVGR